MSIFSDVKAVVTAKEAAESYGFRVSSKGMMCCPFHHDRNPSMKVDNRFHCFGCQADGDVIDFAARLFNLSPYEAAKRLARDFGVSVQKETRPVRVPKNPVLEEKRAFQQRVSRCYDMLIQIFRFYREQYETFAPKTPEETLDQRFIEAVYRLEHMENDLELLRTGTDEEKTAVMDDFGRFFCDTTGSGSDS